MINSAQKPQSKSSERRVSECSDFAATQRISLDSAPLVDEGMCRMRNVLFLGADAVGDEEILKSDWEATQPGFRGSGILRLKRLQTALFCQASQICERALALHLRQRSEPMWRGMRISLKSFKH